MDSWDVIVVGAGPVGSYLSGCLADKGFRVLLLDRKGKTGRQVCAGVIGREAFEEFPLDLDSVLYGVRSITMVSPSGKKLRHSTKSPMAYVVDRVEFDRALWRRALEKGVEFFNLSRVVGVDRKGGKIGVVCKENAGGTVKIYWAWLVVFATGFNPGLVASLGLPGYSGAVVGVQTVGLMEDVEEVEVYLGREIAPGGFAWLVPMGEGRVRIGLVAEKNARQWLDRFVSHPEVGGRLMEEVGPFKANWIPRRPLSRTFGDGFLVVGEAAGQVKATTYGGVYYGLLCAREAVETIEKAFTRGNFGGEVLSDYQRAWEELLGDELRLGGRIREKVAGLEDGDIDRLFVFLGSDGLLPRLRATLKFDWHRETIKFFMSHALDGFLRGRGGLNSRKSLTKGSQDNTVF